MFRLNRFVSTNTPVLFVLLWSTGYIGAKYGLPYAEPFMLLFLRFVLALLLLAPPVTAIEAWLLFGEPLG